MDLNMTLCVGKLFRPINNFECITSRITGLIIILVSIFSILFHIRYIYWSYNHRQYHSHQNFLIFSMIFSSSLFITIIIPSVILQWFTCKRLCSLFYCQLEGFISYLNGCVHMFMLMMISIIRYDTVLHINKTKQYFQQYSYGVVLICWLLGFVFAVPPLFNWNKYIPEGLGFHCGLNWFDRSISSRLYFISAFLFVYFIPLIVLFIVNIRVYYVIYNLLHQQSLVSSTSTNNLPIGKRQSPPVASLNTSSTTHLMKLSKSLTVNNYLKIRRQTDPIQLRSTMRLNRLKADRRFALATIFLVSEYLLSWTPYACVALFYLFHVKYLIEQPLLITICAFIAKVSMIINPFIYISTIKTNQMKVILFWKKCSCYNCRIN